MTIEEMDIQLKGVSDTMKEAMQTMDLAKRRIVDMNASMDEILRLCKEENRSADDMSRTIMQIGIIASKYRLL